ncbi:MAG: porin [Panacagrimonas sp.]
MKKNLLSAFLFSLPAMQAAAAATPLDLFVDRATRQIYAEPGPGRDKLGTFVPAPEPAPAGKPGEAPSAAAPAAAAPAAATPAAPAPKTASTDKKWYERLGLRGYTQFRLDEPLNEEGYRLRAPGDRFIGDNQSLGIRRARVILSGDLSDHVSLYLQPDFASTPTGSSTSNFGQLRDLYADIYFDKAKEFRVRAGQSKIPYGWENLQSSQNRLTPDRSDALNSAVRDERDVAAIFYYTPKVVAERFKRLVKDGLKGSGDYGVFGLGVYNGQGANRAETNDSFHTVAHITYPFEFASGQIVEFGVDAYTGHFLSSVGAITLDGASVTPTSDARVNGFRDQRVAVHFIIYPQPFGLQGEWTVGSGPELDLENRNISVQSLNGGYLQAMMRIHSSLGVMTPYAKFQTYDGGSKFDTNAPRMEVDEVEAGLEWQFQPELELTAAYAHMERTNVTAAPYDVVDGDLLRIQLQWNY